MTKLWISETNFVDLDDSRSLADEIAPRSRSVDWMGIYAFLPDPDPVLRRLSQDVTVYRELLSDAHVWSCCQSRKSGTLSCEWEIRESRQGSIRANKRAFQAITDVMAGMDIYQAVTDMLEAPFFGMSPMEILWKTGKQGSGETGKWLPAKIVGKPVEWFQFDPENNLRFKSMDNMIEGEELPDMKFLLPRHHASYQNPYGERVLSRCFWPVVFKKGGFKFWSIFTEKYGMPWLVGRVPRSTNGTERDLLLTNLKKMVQDAVAVINDDESLTIEEAKGKSASADIYERLISVSNREISKAILGQTLTTELDKGGSFAATKEHMEVRADLVDQDKRMVCEQFNQLFRWIMDLNFAGAAAPEFAFFEEEELQEGRAKRDTELTNQGVEFQKQYYERVYNLEEGDFELRETNESSPSVPGQAGKGEFAETQPGPHYKDEVDVVAAEAAILAAGELEDKLEPVIDMIENAKSFEEIGEKLYELYPEIETGEFQKLMTRAMFVAGLTGHAGAGDET